MKKGKSKSSRDNYLPPELMREVLARLPAKTLIKFRCVCKTWCSLIDSSDFISLHSKVHYNNNNNNNHLDNNARYTQLLAWESVADLDTRDYIITVRRSDTFQTIRKLDVIHGSVQCCNGLVLVLGIDRYFEMSIKLWNPFVRKCLILPAPPMHVHPINIDCFLGYSPSSNDYKVLAVESGERIAVYSLNDHSWSAKSDQMNAKGCGLRWLRVPSTRIVCSGGAIYWVGDELDDDNDKAEYSLFSFDFDVEEFSSVQLPNAVEQSTVWFIFLLGNSVAVFSMSDENTFIWVMEKDGGQDPWRLWFSGETNSYFCNSLKPIELTSTFLSIKYQRSNIIYLQRRNTFLISYWEHQDRRRKLMSYNITSQEIKHLRKRIHGHLYFDTYVESLVFLKGFEGRNLISFP